MILVFLMAGCESNGGGSDTAKYTLTIDISGQGTVTPPSGQKYTKDTVVTLTPTPDSGWIFAPIENKRMKISLKPGKPCYFN